MSSEDSVMSPGDVRTFKRGSGKALVVGVGVWAERNGKWIQLHLTGPNHSHTTVTNNPNSERYHRTLFRDLRRTMIDQQCWPYGSEGSETENAQQPVSRFHPICVKGKPVSDTIIEDRGNL